MAVVTEKDLLRVYRHAERLKPLPEPDQQVELDRFFERTENARIYSYFISHVATDHVTSFTTNWDALIGTAVDHQVVHILWSYLLSRPTNKPSTPINLTPELREWALQKATDEAIIAGHKRIQETGGVELDDVIKRIKEKQAVRGRKQPWFGTTSTRITVT